jgi:hypothetical protein
MLRRDLAVTWCEHSKTLEYQVFDCLKADRCHLPRQVVLYQLKIVSVPAIL